MEKLHVRYRDASFNPSSYSPMLAQTEASPPTQVGWNIAQKELLIGLKFA
jgi:hypothetical protein